MFQSFCNFMMAVPAMAMPWMFQQGGQTPQQPQNNMRQERPAPQRPGMPSATPAPSGAPAQNQQPGKPAATQASAEIASEQVCPGQNNAAQTQAALLCLTNNARAYNKLAAVKTDAKLTASAEAKNQDQVNCGYGHTACGKTFDYWIKNKGYAGKCSAENIAMGQKTPREVFTAWMNSEGHRANILNKDYRDLGVSEVAGSRGPLWVMQLGGC